MKQIGTIKFKITIWYSVFIIILVGITLFLFSFFSAEAVKSKITSNLKSEVMQASHALAKQHYYASSGNIIDTGDFDNVSIYDIQGLHIAGKYLYDFDNISFEDDAVRKINLNGTEYLVYDFFKNIKDSDGMWIRGVALINFTESFNNTLFKMIVVLLPTLLLFGILGGFLIIRIAFMPINKIINTANTISTQNDITKRIPLIENSPKDELYMMTVTLNNMLDKIQEQFEHEKQITLDISHELRTPISVILSYSEYLNELADTEKEKELAARITEQTKKITGLISTLLMLSRIDNGQKVNNEKVNVSELIEIVAEGMCEKAAQKQITITTEIKDNITLPGNETLLMSAFANLIDNGIKYGYQKGYINIKVQKNNNKSEILFEDNGIGISKENINKIWDKFYRADKSRNNDNEGYGLGLALVKSIIELHNGQVSASSILGQGTIFKIIF